MDNKETNKNSAALGAKKQKTHLMTSMAILGTALLLVIVIAAVTLIAGLGGTFNTKSELNGQNASELYAQIESTADASTNYILTATKHGKAGIGLVSLSAEVTTDIIYQVDGDNLYYKTTTTTTYIKMSETSVSKIEQEISIVDGVAYMLLKTNGQVTRRFKQTVDAEAYKESLNVFDSLLWQNSKLFDGAKFEKIDNGYVANSKATDTDLAVTLYSDVVSFFGKHGEWILSGQPTCGEAAYSVTYSENIKPAKVNSSYELSGVVTGRVDMDSSITYGAASVRLPNDAATYIVLAPQ